VTTWTKIHNCIIAPAAELRTKSKFPFHWILLNLLPLLSSSYWGLSSVFAIQARYHLTHTSKPFLLYITFQIGPCAFCLGQP
jgi:hypothetical protein